MKNTEKYIKIGKSIKEQMILFFKWESTCHGTDTVWSDEHHLHLPVGPHAGLARGFLLLVMVKTFQGHWHCSCWTCPPLGRLTGTPLCTAAGVLVKQWSLLLWTHFHSWLHNFNVFFDAWDIYVVRTTVLHDLYKSFLWLLKMMPWANGVLVWVMGEWTQCEQMNIMEKYFHLWM